MRREGLKLWTNSKALVWLKMWCFSSLMLWILPVNNAGISGNTADVDALTDIQESSGTGGSEANWLDKLTETYENATECLETNYYGVKRMIEAFIPLLQLSKSPRIVNVSSCMGKLKNLKHEWAKGVLRDSEHLSEEKIEEVINKYLKDFKEDSLRAKDWSSSVSGYVLSKAALNAYSRIMAKKHPSIQINCVCPGFVIQISVTIVGYYLLKKVRRAL